jgi:hypothetical protein
MSEKTDYNKLADLSVKISNVINKHLAEDPGCVHDVHEIIREVFKDD